MLLLFWGRREQEASFTACCATDDVIAVLQRTVTIKDPLWRGESASSPDDIIVHLRLHRGRLPFTAAGYRV